MMNLDDFKGKVPEPIGKRITLFQVLGKYVDQDFEPLICWLRMDDDSCHRFFIDAWLLHWQVYSVEEMEEVMTEDFEEDDKYQVKDFMIDHQLKEQKLVNVEMDYIESPNKLIGKLSMEIEGIGEILLLDAGDDHPQKLEINIKE